MMKLARTSRSALTVPGEKKNRDTKISHVHLQGRSLKSVPKLSKPRDIAVLYLYDNNIKAIENLQGLSYLTSLYLQNNEISRIENLHNLTNLRKLHLGHNNISVVEGLDNLCQLDELHIEKQTLPDRAPICFDPRTLMALSNRLKILNISHNNINSITQFSTLMNLHSIDASHNDIDDMSDVCQTVQHWYFLREANFAGNPIAKQHRYRGDIVANSNYLECLDGKTISDITRKFIKCLEQEKLAKRSKHSVNIGDSIKDLPKNYSTALQKAVSVSILKQTMPQNLSDDLSTFDERDAVYLAWQTLPKRTPLLRNKFTRILPTAGMVEDSVVVTHLGKKY